MLENTITTFTMSNIVAKHTSVFSFFYFFYFFSFFLLKGERERRPYFHWNYDKERSNIYYFVWKIECGLKKLKEEVEHIVNLYINLLLKVVKDGKVSYRSS